MPPPAPVENWREKRRAERAFKRARAEEVAEATELERLQAIEQASPVPDGAEPLSSEGMGAEPDGDEPGAELDLDVPQQGEEPAQNLAAGPVPSNSVSGTRRRRRRRRRGRRPDRPADAAGPPAAPDGRLDPTGPLEKPSKEG
jgi:hypothetical protein